MSNHLEVLKKQLLKEKNNFERILAKTVISRDNAPTARESASDTSRHRLGNQVLLLKSKIEDINKFVSTIPLHKEVLNMVELWSLVLIKINKEYLKIVIIPENWGGVRIYDFLYVSITSPMGKSILNKKLKDEVVSRHPRTALISFTWAGH